MVGEKSESAATGEELEEGGDINKWFNKGKYICFREKVIRCNTPWYIFTITPNLLYQSFLKIQTHINKGFQGQAMLQLQAAHNKNNKSKQIDLLFNHKLRHESEVPLPLTYDIVPLDFQELKDASWVVLGSTIYFFGASGRKIFYLKTPLASTASPVSLSFESAGRMVKKRKAPKVVALDGKIYVFGNNKKVFGEVFELYKNRFDGRSRELSTPITSSSDAEVLFAVAMEQESKIVVGLNCELVDEEPINLLYADDFRVTKDIAIFVYDSVGDSWVRHTNNLCLNLLGLLCEPIAAGSCLYWFDNKLCAYDLKTGHYFEGAVEDCLFMHVVGINCIASRKLSLLHLVGDFFFLLWADWRNMVLHCTMIRAVRTTIVQTPNCFKLRISVLSCQTFDTNESKYLQAPAIIR